MTNVEFASVIGAIAAGCGKSLSVEAQKVYFDLLGDLPAEIFATAGKRVLLEHRWASFPTVAELREAAVLTQRGEVKELAAGEAWALAWRAVGSIDPDLPHTIERAFSKIPSTVVDAIKALGLLNLCHGDEPVAVVRGQFMKVFEQIAARDKRQAILPGSVKQAIAHQGERSAIAGIVGKIGILTTTRQRDGRLTNP